MKARSILIVLALTSVLGFAADTPSPLAVRAQDALSTISGTLKTQGLLQPVKIVRDRWGVAHIYAHNQHDLFFAQGFVAAQDRLFQMELWKRSGQGHLAEVLGPSALLRDINARLLRYRGDMTAEYASYAPDTQEILKAFTDGINAYIASAEKSGLPLEFQIAGFAPEKWKPEDCLNRMAAFSMTGNSFSELSHAQLLSKLGPEKAVRLMELDPPVKLDPVAALDYAGLKPSLLENLIGSDTRIEFPAKAHEGSNNWTVSGAMTQSGKPIVANDPHRVIAEPSLRYMVHLVAPGWDVIGAGEPGLPGVALGHNQHIAWGFTIFGLDQQDLYLEELNPSNPLEYKTERGWERMRLEKASIAIRGGPNVTADLKFTRHGPVLWQDGRRALALRWVGAEPGTAGYLASLSVDRAQNWEEFEAAMSRWKVPSENIVFGDTQNNIGEHSTGLAPLRKKWTGLLPVPGTGGYEWAGFVPTSELPHSFNPKAGFIATANHRMIPETYPYNVGFEWAPAFRFQRITEVLEQYRSSSNKIRIEDMERLQTDVLSLPAQALQKLLSQAVGQHADQGAQMLLRWDCVLTRDSAAAALYEVWLNELTQEVSKRAYPEDVHLQLEHSQVLAYLSAPKEEIFGPNPATTRDQLLQDALESAEDKLTALQGRDMAAWSWGKLHVVRLRHALDQVPGAAAIVDLSPIGRPGDDYTVNSTEYVDSTFQQVSGASYREILDTADWDRSVAVNTPGQSGQPGSAHYSDLLPLWQEGKYFPLLYSQDAVEKEAKNVLVLEP